MKLAKSYSSSEVESKWYPIWESNGYFKPTFKDNAPSYCIQLPPPNVTGTLHMGHAFQQTLMDALIRYHRMKGYNTLWQPGTDHAGIATQIVVERQLDLQGVSRHDLGREEFVKKVWEWKQYSGNTITNQMRRIGASCDWSRERFTMDEGLSKAVTEVFVSLYEKEYIYRGKRLVNWDVKLQTAVSNLEVIPTDEMGKLWHIYYPIKNSNEKIQIATTRPETLLGDVAIAVNPTDERYKHLIGQKAILPLVGREIPIIADDYVDATFGTGCVKITPAHDFNDSDIGKRHNLEMISILSLDGHINDNAPEKYRGLERFVARKAVLADLTDLGLLGEIKPHKLVVPRGERTDVIIEPMLTDQWFMNMDKFAKRGLELVANGSIRFVPENWTTTYNQWMENIEDWCLSRQLWWGHRIPAYYDVDGNIVVARNLQEAQAKVANGTELKQDNDVLDTWFSSGLWTFSTLGWPENTRELECFLPSSVLVTGFDIIFFWVARMIAFTEEFTGKIPFKDVYITGLVRDANGDKMSKSKGNIIDPLDLIDGVTLVDLTAKRTSNLMNPKQAESIAKQTSKDYPEGFQAFGADALRFTLASSATHGRDIRFDVKRIEGNRNFCNKIWNASKFVLMNVEANISLIGKNTSLNNIDIWILNKLQKLIIDVDLAYTTYRFDIATQKIYEFVWNDFCDWYLELAKVNLQEDNDDVKSATMGTLLQILECICRLIHPFMPYITEEIWQVVAPICNKKNTQSIMLADFPSINEITLYNVDGAIQEIEQIQKLVNCVRNLRGEMNLSPAIKVPLIVETNKKEYFMHMAKYVKILAKVSELTCTHKLDDAQNAPIAMELDAKLMLKVEVDTEVEKIRVLKELEKNSKELEKMQIKLDNPNYLERAPADLVERDRARVEELSVIITQLELQLNKLG